MAAPRPFPAFLGGAGEELIRLWESREPGILELADGGKGKGKKGANAASSTGSVPALAVPSTPETLLRALVDGAMHLHTDVTFSRVVKGRKGGPESLEAATQAGRCTQPVLSKRLAEGFSLHAANLDWVLPSAAAALAEWDAAWGGEGGSQLFLDLLPASGCPLLPAVFSTGPGGKRI